MLLTSSLLFILCAACTAQGAESIAASAANSVTKLDSSGGSVTMTLQGYDWRRFSLVVPPRSAIDFVAQVENSDIDDTTINCKGQGVALFVSANTPPELRSENTTTGDVSSGSTPLYNVLFDTSLLCVTKPEYRKSIKDTSTTHWYLLVQTLVADPSSSSSSAATASTPINGVVTSQSSKIPDTAQCTVTVHYKVVPSADRTIELIAVATISLVFLAVSYRKLFRRLNLDHHRDPGMKRFIFFAVPLFLKDGLYRAVRLCTDGCQERARRRRHSGGKEKLAAKKQEEGEYDGEDEDEDDEGPTCRICRESGEDEVLITPCHCAGSLAYVHQTCLDKWRITAQSQNKDFINSCELCLSPFDKSISKRAQCRSKADFIIPFIMLHLLCMLCTVLGKYTVSEASCSASYDELKPLPYYMLIFPSFGFTLYCLAVLCVDIGLQLTWEDFPTSTSTRGPAKVLSTLKYTMWLMLCPVMAGYFAQVLAYIASERNVWNWEFSLGLGFTLLTILMLFHTVASVLYKDRQNRRRRQALSSADDGSVSTMDDSSPLHGNESVSMASLSVATHDHPGEDDEPQF